MGLPFNFISVYFAALFIIAPSVHADNYVERKTAPVDIEPSFLQLRTQIIVKNNGTTDVVDDNKGAVKAIPKTENIPTYDEGETFKDFYEQWLVFLIRSMKGDSWLDEPSTTRDAGLCSGNDNLKDRVIILIIQSIHVHLLRVVLLLFQPALIIQQLDRRVFGLAR